MSNYLAVATATAAVRQILLNAFSSAPFEFTNASVKTERPEALNEAAFVGANLYLYQVGPNAAHRNAELATRTAGGSLVQRPQVALDLNYLLTFYGDHDTLEPQRLLGCAASALNAQPVLTRPLILEAIATAREFGDYLKGSDLADQTESVRISPLYLSLEELSKLWTVFFQTAHTLSIFYQASVVLIDADLVPQAQLPVRAAGLSVSPQLQPLIENIAPKTGEAIVAGTTLVVSGQRLTGDTTRALADGSELPVTNIDPGGKFLDVTIPTELLRAGTLTAGTKNLRIVREMLTGSPPQTVRLESNSLPFVLRPAIERVSVLPAESDDARARRLQVDTDATIKASQPVALLLNKIGGQPPASYKLNASSRAQDSNQLVFAILDVEAGTYLVRLQVDGAESVLVVDSDPTSPTFNRFTAPQVVIEKL